MPQDTNNPLNSCVRLAAARFSNWTLRYSLVVLFLVAFPWDTTLAEKIHWQRVQLDSTFRSEGVTANDVNRDGKMDVIAGDLWYQAPDWKSRELRTVGTYIFDKEWSQSFANFTCDVNRDGWDDLILVGSLN